MPASSARWPFWRLSSKPMMTDITTRYPVAYESRKGNAEKQAYPRASGGGPCHASVPHRQIYGQRPPGVLSDFALQTDNQAASWLRTKRDINRFLVRWLDEIDKFLFDVQHVSGRLNPQTR